MKNHKMFANEVILDLFCNIVQFGPKNIDYFQWAEGGDKLVQLMTMPIPLIRNSIIFEVVAAGQQGNRIMDRQNWMQVAGLITQYYQSMILLTQGQPQLQQIVLQKALVAATEAMKQILDTFDIRNKDRIIVEEVEKLLNATPGAGNVPQAGAGNGTSPNGNPQQRLDLLTAIAGQFGGGGPKAAPAI